jgi:hypothetical protein
MHPGDGRLTDKGRVSFGPNTRGVWSEVIAIDPMIPVRHENVLRLLEFLGYPQEEETR